MFFFAADAGLRPAFPSPAPAPDIADVETEEAAVCLPPGPDEPIDLLVAQGDDVARGAPVASLRHAPEIRLVAPVAGRVARLSLRPGRRLSEIVLFRTPDGPIQRYDLPDANDVEGLRGLMQSAGVWPLIRRRPFGGMPAADEVPAAIVVMATDTRMFAPDPRKALEGRDEDLARGLDALLRLTKGPVLLCHGPDAVRVEGRVRCVARGTRHPQGSAGLCIHRYVPAGLDSPVWDIHAEDVAALGVLLKTGVLPMDRLVSVAGAALREGRTLRTHPGADLRQLTRRIVRPGQHITLSGSPLDGQAATWLGPRDRQITVLPRPAAAPRPHWLVAALTRSPGPKPAIPTAALTQAFGASLPAAPFIRALAAGDDEAAMKLGVLSLLEEDVALADYVLGEEGRLTVTLRAMLDRIQSEFAA